MSNRRDRQARAVAALALPDFIELVIVGVRAGNTPTAAVLVAATQASPALRPALDELSHRLQRGHRLAGALQALPDYVGPEASGFADILATTERYGLPIEPALDRLALEVRTGRRHQAERRARTLPVRLSFPLVVCTLPSFVLLAIVPAVLGALSTLRGTTP